MKNFLTLCLAGTIAVFTGFTSADADQLPQPAIDALQQREQRLSHLAFDWRLTLNQAVPAQPENAILGMQRAMRKQFPGALDKNGIMDEKTRQRMTEDEVSSVTHLMKGFSSGSINQCRIVRDGDATLVTGAIQQNTIRQILEYYDGDTGMIVNRSNKTTTGRRLPTFFPVAWGCPGKSVEYREPFQDGFELLPEHFSTLVGLNPLAMYGTSWNLASTTPDAWVLTSHVEKGAFAPFSLKLTLDRKHDGAPSKIEVTGEKSSTVVEVLSFQHYQNDWVDNKVRVSSQVPGIKIRSETWDLQKVEPSKPIVVSLSARPIADYRLLGNNLTVTDALFTTKQQATRIVYYPWEGHFPKIEDLEKIKHIQHPGEATPDPGKTSSALPLVGGILCLVGGVWMFKRRGLS